MSSTPFSEVLRSLADLDEKAVPLKSVIAAMGARIHGAALLLLSLPDAVPLPVPSVSTVLGFPIVMISAHLALFGEKAGLPARVEHLALPRKTFNFLSRYLSPALRRLELLSRPRWAALAQRERLIGVASAYLGVILILPLPLMNSAPAILLAVLSWGLIQKDGVVIAIGLIGSALLTFTLLFLASWLSAAGLSIL